MNLSMMSTGIMMCGLAAGSQLLWGGTDLDSLCRLAFERVEQGYMGKRTNLIYSWHPSKVTPASQIPPSGIFLPESGMNYGRGMEDTSIVGGVALSMLADWYAVTGDEGLRARAERVYRGVRGLVTAHGIPGFVARGLCEEDGKGICARSSIDQVTHFIHGLWRYYRSPLSSEEARRDIGQLFTAVATRMKTNCTPENDYDFLRADGSRDERGIQRMWKNHPHERCRLPMIYLATWVTTGDASWKALYDGLFDEALTETMRLADPAVQKKNTGLMPDYTLLQMQSSLEVLYAEDPEPGNRARILEAMHVTSAMSVPRAIRLNGGNSRWLCGAGETLLAQLYVPGAEFPEEMVALMKKSLTEPPLPTTGSCRMVHLAAVYWRWRRVTQGAAAAVAR